MGDRANVVVVDRFDTPPLYLYTHWSGYRLGDIVARALSREQRWDDGPYLARIVFCEMIKGDEAGETGFGIATGPPDNEHPYLVLDIARQRVLVGDASAAGTLRDRIDGDEPEGFIVVPFRSWRDVPAAYIGEDGDQ